MSYWYKAETGELDPFVLVVEGSIPNEKIKKEGYWAAFGTNAATGQPITTNEWIDRLAPIVLGAVDALIGLNCFVAAIGRPPINADAFIMVDGVQHQFFVVAADDDCVFF